MRISHLHFAGMMGSLAAQAGRAVALLAGAPEQADQIRPTRRAARQRRAALMPAQDPQPLTRQLRRQYARLAAKGRGPRS